MPETTIPSVSVLRPEDLLALRFEFINLGFAPRSATKATLVRVDASKDAFIVVHFPQQHIAEQAFLEVVGGFPIQTPPPKFDEDPGPKDIDEGKAKEVPPAPLVPVKSRISGPSRLVFKVPRDVDSIPYTLQTLLEKCREYELSVAPVALPPPQVKRVAMQLRWIPGRMNPQPQVQLQAVMASTDRAGQLIAQMRGKVWAKKSVLARRGPQLDDALLSEQLKALLTFKPRLALPDLHETAIEAPYRLLVSPNKYAAWVHLAAAPKASPVSGRVELWHTRLATWLPGTIRGTSTEDDDALRTVRAIWATDSEFDPGQPFRQIDHAHEPFRMVLDEADRHNIVHLSSNFLIPSYTPLPIEVDQFILSALGAWMNTRGAWKPPKSNTGAALTVQEWRQRGTMGRDHYVRVVYKGFLFPFGHAASLVKISERKFHNEEAGNPAYLRQRMFLVVRQPEKFYGSDDPAWPQKYDRHFPFTRIRITTLVTPNLESPEGSDLKDKSLSLFWPKVGEQDFQFHCIAETLDGEEVSFQAPLLFADASVAYDPETMMPAALADYLSATSVTRCRRPLDGQTIMFAPSNKPGDTSFAVESLTFGAHIKKLDGLYGLGDHPAFYPCLRRAQLFIPAVQHLTGQSGLSDIEYHDTYLNNGFNSNNKGQVFARLPGLATPTNLDFSNKGDKTGGLVKPNIRIMGLSRTLGPVSGKENVDGLASTGTLDPGDFFSGLPEDLMPKIFGCINLADILDATGVNQPPKFVTEALDVVESFLNDVAAFLYYAGEIENAGGAIATIATNLTTDINNILSHAKLETLAVLLTDLDSLKTNATSLAGALPAVNNLGEDIKREAQRRLDQLNYLLKNASFPEEVTNFVKAIEMAKEMRVKFEWQPKLKNWGFESGAPLFIADNDGKSATLLIAVEMRAKTGGVSKPSADILCSLENFTLDLIAPASFIKLYFDKLQFFASAGKKPDVNVVLNRLEFVGVLSFVEALRSLIPLDGFSDPPALDVTEQGIAASYSLGLPTVAVGMFSLQNLSLGAGFTIPFIGDPLSVRFNFCERQSPFMLTVMMFGGGGFFALTLDPQGVQILEAAFEFGASISVDFGVASGGVKVVAGIYFKMEVNSAELTGYFQLAGNVEVLGIVSVSIELYLELRFEFASGKCVGRATLTLEIEIAFFSHTVEISCERKFAGSNGDPTFAQVMGAEPPVNPELPVNFPWSDYCQAFA